MSAGSSDASSCSTPRLHLTTPAVPPAPAPLPFDCALWPPRRPITARRPHCPAPLAPLPSLPLPMLLLPDRAHAAAALCVHSRRSRYLMPRRGSTVLARLCAPAAPLALYVAVDVTRAAHGYYSHLAAPIRRKTHAQLTNAPSAAPGAAGTGSRLGSQKQTKHPEASWPARGGLSS
ncbi:hypothetical protein LPJ56_000209 [Coemansia sp. RSA 2599]|nr:hypothetical protein LPJ56_000209 [Coemansia sp. RSA 2599]